jgi:spermidine/putrescine transport system ATP-binding protein
MSDIYAVEVRDVVKLFPRISRSSEPVAAVDHVNLAIRKGEFFTMLGPSGCGKTTTLRMIAGFEVPTTGDVFIQGDRITDVPPNKRPVNMVFQNYALFPHLSVGDNVGFGLSIKHVPKAARLNRVREALALVQLQGMEDRRPGQLSGGQQQRVALARALVNRPSVLLLDEPLGALDLKLRKAMQIELKHLQEQVGITFIYVTHDQEEALTMSDRVAVMDGGHVLQVGTPKEIYEQPNTRFVSDFIGETNFLAATIDSVHGERAEVTICGRVMPVSCRENGWRSGQEVTVAVRPEKLMLRSPGAKGASKNGAALSGQIKEMIYIGTDTRYVIRLETGETCVTRIQNVQARNLGEYQVGDPVEVTWSVEDAHPLKD